MRYLNLAMLLLSLTVVNPSQSAECAAAEGDIGNRICQSPILKRADLAERQSINQLARLFDGRQKAILMKDQENWLNLRVRACPEIDDDDIGLSGFSDEDDIQTVCLERVYKKRVAELKALTTQAKESGKAASAADFLHAVNQRMTGKVKPELVMLQTDGSEVRGFSQLPETCREFDALSAGVWSFSMSDRGAKW